MIKQLLPFLALLFIATCSQAQTPSLWGMTPHGGSSEGTIFQLDTTGAIGVDYHFSGLSTGSFPFGSFIQASDTLLYGLTFTGGANYSGSDNGGALISYNIATGTETILHSFGSGATDGVSPYASLLQASNGLLYGTTFWGGTNYLNYEEQDGGTIFSYDISTGEENVLHSFGKYPDGSLVDGSLIQGKDSLLYGVTPLGGAFDTIYGGNGTIFSYNMATGTETVLYSFGSGGANDGDEPQGALILVNDSLLYGLTTYGGKYDEGTIFSYNIHTGNVIITYNFGNGTDASRPSGALIRANNGLYYGLTWAGGTTDSGAIFSYDISNDNEIVLHSFGPGDGKTPFGSLIQASNGLLYGTTFTGGTSDSGTVFSYNISTGTEKVIHNFTGADGASPYGDLLEVTNVTSGINQVLVNNDQLSVYPNPSSDFVHATIQLYHPSNLQLRLVNMLGQTVWVTNAGTVSNYQNNISVAGLTDGVYVLQATTGTKIVTQKLVVTH